jgi:hypothetical protein
VAQSDPDTEDAESCNTSTKSVRESIFNVVKENGRTYHAYQAGCEYLDPPSCFLQDLLRRTYMLMIHDDSLLLSQRSGMSTPSFTLSVQKSLTQTLRSPRSSGLTYSLRS